MLSAAKHLKYLLENKPMQILREVYPEGQNEVLRFAQNDSERAQDDSIGPFFRSQFTPAEIRLPPCVRPAPGSACGCTLRSSR